MAGKNKEYMWLHRERQQTKFLAGDPKATEMTRKNKENDQLHRERQWANVLAGNPKTTEMDYN